MNNKYDVLILGKGLAGSVLSVKMLLSGKRIRVFHQPETDQSTAVSAGLFNPVSGKRFATSWMTDDCFRSLHTFYPELEVLSGRKFFYPLPLVRIIPDPGTGNDWLRRLSEPGIAPYVDGVLDEVPGYHAPHGAISLKMAGWLDTDAFLKAVNDLLQAHDALEIHSEEVLPEPTFNGFRIGSASAPIAVDCGGLASSKRFPKAPFTPMKGEILNIYCPELPNDRIVTGSCFVSPVDDHTFRLGATYDWRNINKETTEEARLDLCSRFEKMCSLPYEVTGHRAGIRPAVRDRRPMLGQHPHISGYYLFNGLGSKGISLAPYLADLLIAHLFKGEVLPAEIDLARFNP